MHVCSTLPCMPVLSVSSGSQSVSECLRVSQCGPVWPSVSQSVPVLRFNPLDIRSCVSVVMLRHLRHSYASFRGTCEFACRVLYDDQETEWINITLESQRVVVDKGILEVTDAMKAHLGIPIEGTVDAVSEASRLR